MKSPFFKHSSWFIGLSLTALTLSGFAAEKSKTSSQCSACLQEFFDVFINVNKKASPAVVFIQCEVSASEFDDPNNPYGYQNPYDYFGDDFLHRFFGVPPQGKMPKAAPQISQGSGFFISPEGYILTNAHVVKGAEKIKIGFDDNRELEATLVGVDPHTDLAVLKVEGKNFHYLNFGDSEKTEVGQWVVAIGSPFQLQATVTKGIISAKGRQNLRITDLEDFMQTDTVINPGNSGGPLLNLDAEVIGINTAILSRSGGYMGIGFAIPSNMAKNVTSQIIEKGSVTRGFLGISLQPVDKDIADAFNLDKAEGALVSEVTKDSPADKAGLKQGDIILEYNGIPVRSIGGFRNDISLMKPGSIMKLKINRKGQPLTIDVTLGSAADKTASNSVVTQKLGLEVDTLTSQLSQQLGLAPNEEGVVITRVRPGSPSATAGLRPGYLIQAINHKRIANTSDFDEAVAQVTTKSRILLLVRQGTMTRYYSIKLD